MNHLIDHTLLKIMAQRSDYQNLFENACKHNFASVCIPPILASEAVNYLSKTDIKVCSVIGFPSGLSTLDTKLFETQQLLKNGVHEIDMVANFYHIKNRDWHKLESEITSIKKLCQNNILKVIIESSILSKDEVYNCCLAIKNANADFVKTSSGFNGPGARLADVIYMKNILYNSNVKIKASGGIKNLMQAKQFVNAGATRIGTSSGVHIMTEFNSRGQK